MLYKKSSYGIIPEVKALIDKRKRLNIKQYVLAKKIGISAKDLSRYEHGINHPSAPVFVAWLQALGYEIIEREEIWYSTIPNMSKVRFNVIDTSQLVITQSTPKTGWKHLGLK